MRLCRYRENHDRGPTICQLGVKDMQCNSCNMYAPLRPGIGMTQARPTTMPPQVILPVERIPIGLVNMSPPQQTVIRGGCNCGKH